MTLWKGNSKGVGVKTKELSVGGGYGYFLQPHNAVLLTTSALTLLLASFGQLTPLIINELTFTLTKYLVVTLLIHAPLDNTVLKRLTE